VTDFSSADVRPAEVEAYLRSRHWSFIQEITHGSLWTAPAADEDVQVFVPRKPGFGDYDRRLHEVLRAVSEVEARPELEVIRDLIEAAADVIRFRLPFTFPDASVRFSDALTLFQRARDTMRAAALATHHPSPAFAPGANPGQVDAFLSELRLGHTEAGSYVVPVIAPLGTIEPPPDEVVPRTDEPFGRFVTLRLASALSAVEQAVQTARRTNDLLVFAEAVEVGVSANLCTAVSELTRATGAEPTDTERLPSIAINLSWSPSRPVPEETRSEFVIAREDASVLEDAAAFLKRAEARRRVTIVGQVVRLEREHDEPAGSIGIRGQIDDGGDVRMLVVRLSPADYERALHAHDHRQAVTCSGVLERHGTRWRLAEPIDFIAQDSLFQDGE
jgi:hypothetical protein